MEGITEKEAIEITVAHGYEGEEFDTAKWKKNGSIDPTSGTFKKLISKLETIYNDVSYVGKGKKRRYFLSDKKEMVTKREFKYKGTVAKDEDILMQEYIFNKFIVAENLQYTYSGWLEELKFPNMVQYDIGAMKEEIKEWYRGEYFLNGIPYDSGEIAYKFIEELFIRSKAVFENSIKRLRNDGRIEFYYKYMSKKSTEHPLTNNKEPEIDEITYTYFLEKEKEMVEGYDVDYRVYKRQMISPKGFTKKYKEIFDEVQPALEEATGIEYVYYLIHVEVLDSTKHVEEITDEQFIEAYFKRFVELASQRQNNPNYKNELDYLWKRFFYFHTMILIDMCFEPPFEEFIEMLKKTRKNHYQEVSDFLTDYVIHKPLVNNDGEILMNDIEKEEMNKRRNTFGKIK